MQINWFIIAAQLINFLILVFLLRHFLYGRIISAMDKREQYIASRIAEAELCKEKARKEEESCHLMQQEMTDNRQQTLTLAKEDVDKTKQELLEKARAEVQLTKDNWYKTVEREKREFVERLREEANTAIFAIVRQVLHDLANDELEQNITRVFIGRLEQMTGKEKEDLQAFLRIPGSRILIASAFDFAEGPRRRIEDTLNKCSGFAVAATYQVTPDIISGIELKAGDLRISWNLSSYLDSLEERVTQIAGEKTGS